MTRFIDYFFICGLNEREKPRVYTSYDDGVHNDCDSKLIPSVLCHYPRNVPENPWNPAELWKFCSPGGLWAGQSSTNQKPRFHSFLITREDGSRCYGHVLTFRERCVDRSVKQAVESILSMQPTKQLFVDKCLCFITQQAYINTCEQILRKLYVLFVSNTTPPVLPVESYLYNLLYEIPLVNEGSSLKLSCMGHDDPVVVQQPSSSELPLLDVYLSRVVHLLGGARNLVNLMTSLLLEHQILLVSEDCHKLTLVGEGITSLMFPFQWQHTIVTMLPYEVATHFFDAPVPYIIGVLANQNKKGLVRQALEVNQCYVDLDNHIVEWPEEQPTFPNDVEIIEKINSIIKVYNKEVKASSMTSSVTSLDNQPTMEATDVDLLKSNETVERVANIAHKVGAFQSMDEINSLHANILGSDGKQHMNESLLREHKLNASIRETLSSIFIVIFAQYDKFVIQYNEDMAGGEEFNPETQNNFDKISFLSDQPESRLRFLISFLDTQMFASFVDNFIVSCNNIHVKDPLLKLFDDRIDQSKLPIDVKSPSSASSPRSVFRSLSVSSSQNISTACVGPWIKEAEAAITKRLKRIDIVSGQPHQVAIDEMKIISVQGTFPHIKGTLLDNEGLGNKRRHLKRNDDSRKTFKRQPSVRETKWRKVQEARSKLLRQPSMSEYSPELIAQTNWMFVEKLLKDTKHKTKKLLVCKMGREAFELGHGELAISDLEESTWIASLCDLLERVWSHGLLTNHKHGKSALWSHLIQYQTYEHERTTKRHHLQHLSGSSPSLLEEPRVHDPTTSYYSLPRSFPRKKKEIHVQISKRVNEQQTCVVPPANYNIVAAMNHIQSMREVQTEVGRSRAWIRLALEQKQLHSHLKLLLTNHSLLDRMYKRYSLLQCDDEREQFLFHLLSLNAVDFQCFTNAFTKTQTEYRVWVFPGRQFSGLSQTTANVYMKISGEKSSTHVINVPRGCLEFTFMHQNLGVLTTLVVGHDNAGILPKWLLGGVVVRNEITNQTFHFPCHRWIGRGIDDNSLERLLVSNIVSRGQDFDEFSTRISKEPTKLPALGVAELQERMGRHVNAIVKYQHHPIHDVRTNHTPPPASFTKLLVDGLVATINKVFTHGIKSGGLFQKKIFAWDVLVAGCNLYQSNPQQQQPSNPQHTRQQHTKVGGDWFLGSRNNGRHHNRDDETTIVQSQESVERMKVSMDLMCSLCNRVSNIQHTLGKDEMFVLIICISLQQHLLPVCLPKIASLAQASNYFDESAFLSDNSAVSFLAQVLSMLNEYKLNVDDSLFRGLKSKLIS